MIFAILCSASLFSTSPIESLGRKSEKETATLLVQLGFLSRFFLYCARCNRKYYTRRCAYFLVGFVMSKETAFRKQVMLNSKIIEILSTVPYERGFHFFTAMSHYTGETAISLDSLVQKLQVIDADSVGFHFSRKDFQNWIREVIKDEELAEVVDRIKENQSNEDLRKEIVKTIQTRLTELRKLVVAKAPEPNEERLTLS